MKALKLKGKYNEAVIYSDGIDKVCEDQILHYLNDAGFEGSVVRVMPDVHKGSGNVVGFTATLKDKIIPKLIGEDIGCGMSAWNLGRIKLNFEKLDKFIKKFIPSGSDIHDSFDKDKKVMMDNILNDSSENFFENVNSICNERYADRDYIYCSLGTLGGGNHFIEIARDENGDFWLVIHSGSRGFGAMIATYYQDLAQSSSPKESKNKYLERADAERYISDMKVAQIYAHLNRKLMGYAVIEKFFKLKEAELEFIESVHNYISFEDNMYRKGAISAHEGERVVIPFSMADGSVIGTGRGNIEWNLSAPHGAGRKMSRGKARESLKMDYYRKRMHGIWSSCVRKSTIEESPMAYKKPEKVLNFLEDTVTVEKRLKPVYNFKAL